ncbi:MAG: endonuclease III [Clostridiales bacterium]|jgi:endonuclease-3|nr:endonuclease III [Clostridiales bacterium]
MTKKERAIECINALKKEYPDSLCSLDYKNSFELLVAARLSAQCTDARVNTITPALFEKYKTLDDYANANLSDVENLVRSCGFYRTKAKDIIGMATMIRDDFDKALPEEMDDLLKLPGVGRKTANLIRGDVFGKPAIVADTHLIRISNRLGLANSKNPEKVERQLWKILPPEESNDFCHRCVLHGRAVCTARKAKCDECCMESFCKKNI